MPWVNSNFQVSHPRVPWADEAEDVLVHSPLSVMNGKKGTSERTQYFSAKRAFNMDAAYDVVERAISSDTLDTIIAYVISKGLNGRIIMPHPAFDDDDGAATLSETDQPKNAIPFAYANYLSERTGLPVDDEIVQIARVGRTKLPKWPRFLCQPSFGGVVRVDQPYIIADDAVTTAGTFAALRSYIVRNGGTVLLTTALANKTGTNCRLAISSKTLKLLSEAFGEGFATFWRETLGHEVDCLTEAEGEFLRENADVWKGEGCAVGDELLQRLRNRINQAAAKNR